MLSFWCCLLISVNDRRLWCMLYSTFSNWEHLLKNYIYFHAWLVQSLYRGIPDPNIREVVFYWVMPALLYICPIADLDNLNGDSLERENLLWYRGWYDIAVVLWWKTDEIHDTKLRRICSMMQYILGSKQQTENRRKHCDHYPDTFTLNIILKWWPWYNNKCNSLM